MDVDVVPVGELVKNRLVRLRIGQSEVLKRLVGEDDAPSERVIRRVALVERDVVMRVRLLQQEGEVETRGSASQDGDLHAAPSTSSVRPHAASSSANSWLSCTGRR